MPLFFFDLYSRDRVEIDVEGAEFDTLELAYLDAHRAARDIWAELSVGMRESGPYGFRISDRRRVAVMDLPFNEALGLELTPVATTYEILSASRKRRAQSAELNKAVREKLIQAGIALREVRATIDRIAKRDTKSIGPSRYCAINRTDRSACDQGVP